MKPLYTVRVWEYDSITNISLGIVATQQFSKLEYAERFAKEWSSKKIKGFYYDPEIGFNQAAHALLMNKH